LAKTQTNIELPASQTFNFFAKLFSKKLGLAKTQIC